ncbi:hypothetical protein [Micromonospora zhanjiangensis]|uniref:DUF4276 family protein n=1 Tax=Micromonospora zhanjiangensis TaxID=1522057 RepID=A0ABV8KJN4_9ACTN
MTARTYSGLFVSEGTSDLPLADLIEALFLDRGVNLFLSRPDFVLLPRVARDVRSKIHAGLRLTGPVDVVVVHRDADNAGAEERRREITEAASAVAGDSSCLPVIPVRMTEAWLLLDEGLIRQVAGNPRGRGDLQLPRPHEVESRADPKHVLQQCLLRAADVTGRKRESLRKRFPQHRRQLLERLDRFGSVTTLTSWKQLTTEIDAVTNRWSEE